MKFSSQSHVQRAAVLIVLLLLSLPAVADRSWMYVGQIDRLDLSTQTVIVNDLLLKITASSKFTSQRGADISARLLEPGDLVGVNAEIVPGIGRVITELRVYPADAEPRTRSDDD